VVLSFESVRNAAAAISEMLPVTPAWSYPLLDAAVGCEVVVKHENAQPTGAFKVRGGLNLIASVPTAELAAGLVAASTGNHAQSVAYAARRAGIPAVIVMPESAPAIKVRAVRALGAEVVLHGPAMDQSVTEARRLAAERGLRYVDPGNDPAIVHGHATVYLELFRQRPDLQAVFVPIGSGTGAAGACLVRDRLAPHCRIIGVQSDAAPAAYQAWRSGSPASAPCRTRVSGLATGVSFDLPQRVLGGRLDEFLLVSDDAMEAAMRLLASHAHTLAEAAGAAALAGLLATDAKPERVGVICTGGNASAEELRALAR
jgi:threonine dehydratase